MNGAHFHLLVNHMPIIFPIVGLIVLIVSLISKSEAVKRTAFLIFILGALGSVAAMTSGEEAEEVVEKIAGVTESEIEHHEEAAETFAIMSYVLGGISVLGLWASFKQNSFSTGLTYAALAFSLVLIFFAKQAGTSGGEIRHTEIREGYIVPSAASNTAESDDDD